MWQELASRRDQQEKAEFFTNSDINENELGPDLYQ